MYEDKVYVLGGYGDGTSRLRQQTMRHPIEREAQVAKMLEPRSSFPVAVLDDRLMVMGGCR